MQDLTIIFARSCNYCCEISQKFALFFSPINFWVSHVPSGAPYFPTVPGVVLFFFNVTQLIRFRASAPTLIKKQQLTSFNKCVIINRTTDATCEVQVCVLHTAAAAALSEAAPGLCSVRSSVAATRSAASWYKIHVAVMLIL